MIKLFSISLLCLAALSCNKKEHKTEEIGRCGNTCIDSKIVQFSQSSQICDSTASVKRYTFQTQGVYLFDQGNCGADFTISVLNENCDTLGYLNGFAGNTQINGVDFYQNAVFEYEVWGN